MEIIQIENDDYQKFLDELSLDKFKAPNHIEYKWLYRADTYMALGSGCIYLGYYIYSQRVHLLVEGFLILTLLIWNIFLLHREAKLTQLEMTSRFVQHIQALKTRGIADKQDSIPLTNIPTISLTRKVSNGGFKLVPSNLLCKDEQILLTFGDVAPCKCECIDYPKLILERGELLKPSLFETPVNGLVAFKTLERPVDGIIEAALGYSRPEPVLTHQLLYLDQMVYGRIIWVVIALSLLVNFLRFFLQYYHRSSPADGFELILLDQVYILFPLLSLPIPTLALITRSYCNAQILALFDGLQSSKEAFEDEDDVDEFDAAPAPTKDLFISWGAIGSKFFDQLLRFDISFLARTTGLVESLANISVLCAIDREGTISGVLPSIEQLFMLGENEEPIILDVREDKSSLTGIKFEDKDWNQFLQVLRPFALNRLICGCSQRKRLDTHLGPTTKAGNLPLSRHTCLCTLAKEVGFNKDESVAFTNVMNLETFSPSQATSTHDYHFEVPSMSSVIVHDRIGETYQMFTDGNVDLLLSYCADYWNGKDLAPVNNVVLRKISEFYQNAILNDFYCVAMSYRPLYPWVKKMLVPNAENESVTTPVQDVSTPIRFNSSAFIHKPKLLTQSATKNIISKVDSSNTLIQEEFSHEIVKGQTLLGLTSFTFSPKPNVVDIVEDLGLCGIRFVYFSSAPEMESKNYAERLGLEIDWNSCIILSKDNGNSQGYIDIHDMKAKLPRGIDNIRPHLRDVDDVPLHVSLFAECEPKSIVEMVKIFQENGEIVCCIGSSLNDANVKCFSMADISIAIDPVPIQKNKQGSVSSLWASSGFNTSPCALTLHSDTSLYTITQIIREARTLVLNARQGFSFLVGCYIGLSFTEFLASCCLLPPIFNGYQLMYVAWIICPLITFSFLFTPHSKTVMTEMPVKNVDHLKDKFNLIWYQFTRFCILPPISCIVVFTLLLIETQGPGESFTLLNGFDGIPWSQLPASRWNSIFFAQNMALFTFVFHISLISSTFIWKTKHLYEKSPFKNKLWITSVIIALLLQILFWVLSLLNNPISITRVPWYVWLISLLPAFLLVIISELVKIHDTEEWIRFQKRSKLEFNTKLGMHSPL